MAGAHGYGFGFGPSLYINTGLSNCYQQRMVQTRRGLRLRTVNVCAYATDHAHCQSRKPWSHRRPGFSLSLLFVDEGDGVGNAGARGPVAVDPGRVVGESE